MSIKKIAKGIAASTERMLGQALALQKAGKLEEALNLCRNILRKVPHSIEALKLGASLCVRLRRYDDALEYFGRLVERTPSDPTVIFNYAASLATQGRFAEALPQLDRAVVLKPDYAGAHYNRGVVLQNLGRHEEAVGAYDRAIALHSTDPNLHNNLGVALHNLGRNEEALTTYGRALALDPRFTDALTNSGHSARDLGRYEDALHYYERVTALVPGHIQARLSQAVTRLRLGDFARGLPLFEVRWDADPKFNRRHNFQQPIWAGERLEGRTILLHAEQGHGDTIQMGRYVPLVKAHGAERIVLEIQPALIKLFSESPELCATTVVASGSDLPPFDVYCPVMSLPLACRTRVETIPSSAAYLESSPTSRARWRERLGREARPHVGFAWAGNPSHLDNRKRSIGLKPLLPMIDSNPHCTFVSLQQDCSAEDRQHLLARSNVKYFTPDELGDFAETAALISCMDVVLTVDTAVAHLAGALGKPTWLMLSFVSDWRWLLERSDSPWYPTMSLFRQTSPANWQSVIEAISRELQAVLRPHSHSPNLSEPGSRDVG